MGWSSWTRTALTWAMAIVCLLLIAAIVLPIRSDSGPATRTMATAIARHHRQTNVWPADETAFSLGRNDLPGRRFGYQLERVAGKGAFYRIVLNDQTQRWWLGNRTRPIRIEP